MYRGGAVLFGAEDGAARKSALELGPPCIGGPPYYRRGEPPYYRREPPYYRRGEPPYYRRGGQEDGRRGGGEADLTEEI